MHSKKRRGKYDDMSLIRKGVNPYIGFMNVCSLSLNWENVEYLDKYLRIVKPFYAYIDEEDIEKVLNHSRVWNYNNKQNLVKCYNTYLHRLIMGAEDPDMDVHHLNTDPTMNCKRNLLLVKHDEHPYYHSIIRRIKKKGNFSRRRLIIELSENVICKMRKPIIEEYEFRLLLFEKSLCS